MAHFDVLMLVNRNAEENHGLLYCIHLLNNLGTQQAYLKSRTKPTMRMRGGNDIIVAAETVPCKKGMGRVRLLLHEVNGEI